MKKNEKIEQLIFDYNSFFCKLTDLIQPKVYFSSDQEVLEMIESDKKFEFRDEDLSKASKHRRAKLDPSLNKTVTQIANEYQERGEKNVKNELLKQRLNQRINELRSQRGGTRDKNKKKAQRGNKEERRKNNNAQGAKQKGFIKLKANEKKENNKKWHQNNKKEESDKNKKKDKNNNENGNENNFVYSKFDLVSDTTNYSSESQLHQSKKRKLEEKLKEAEREKRKIEKLQEKDEEAAQQYKKSKSWKSALEKSEGVKVKDDINLIKKSLRRKKKIKKKSAEKWKERNEAKEMGIQKRQEKRNKNIKMRKDRNRDQKLAKLKTKGRVINTKKKNNVKVNNKKLNKTFKR